MLRVDKTCSVRLVLVPVAGEVGEELNLCPIPPGTAGEVEDLTLNPVTVITQYCPDLPAYMTVIKTRSVQLL